MAHKIPQNVTRSEILAAIALCDKRGERRFLAEHGYQAAKRWQLRHRGQSYSSKAILGVAAGLCAREFSGGARHTVAVLERLGFHVRDGKRPGLPAKLAEVWATARTMLGRPAYQAPALGNEPVANFASGSNRVGDIRGLVAAGHDIGVAFPELTADAIAELETAADTDVQVFVDSGAFSELGGKPIHGSYWPRYLSACYELGLVLGGQLHIVAPDKVGDANASLLRLQDNVDQLAALAAIGVRILIPVQKDPRFALSYTAACIDRIVGGRFQWTPALPCKKAATSVQDAVLFAADRQVQSIHLLGLGAKGRNARAYFDGIAAAAPGVLIQCDANVLRSQIGATNGRGGGPRLATAALRVAKSALGALATAADHKALQVALVFGAVL